MAEIETDKSTLVLDLQQDGYVAKILWNEDDGAIKLGEPIVIIVSELDDIKAFENYSSEEYQ